MQRACIQSQFYCSLFSELKEEHPNSHISESFRNSSLDNFLRHVLSKDIKEQLLKCIDLGISIDLAQSNLYPQLDMLTERNLYAILYQVREFVHQSI